MYKMATVVTIGFLLFGCAPHRETVYVEVDRSPRFVRQTTVTTTHVVRSPSVITGVGSTQANCLAPHRPGSDLALQENRIREDLTRIGIVEAKIEGEIFRHRRETCYLR